MLFKIMDFLLLLLFSIFIFANLKDIRLMHHPIFRLHLLQLLFCVLFRLMNYTPFKFKNLNIYR